MMPDTDYYKILGIGNDADMDEIKAAYRKQALKYHPDRNIGNPSAVQKMAALNEAYAVLSDPDKRQKYDGLQQQYGPSRAYTHFRNTYSQQEIFSGTDLHEILDELARSFGFRGFDEISREFVDKPGRGFEYKSNTVHIKGSFFFSSFSFGRRPVKNLLHGAGGRFFKTLLGRFTGPPLPMKGRDLHDTIHIDTGLAEKGGPYAYFHESRSKKLLVKLPARIRHGQKIRLGGMGEKGRHGAGDLYLTIETKPRTLMDRLRRYLPF